MADKVKSFGSTKIVDTGTVTKIEVAGTVRFIINHSTGAVTMGAVDGTGAVALYAKSLNVIDQISLTGTSNKAYLQTHVLTTTQRDNLSPSAGMVIYNSTDTKLQVYAGGTWVNLH